MAYKITDLTRHVAASGDYPRGDIKNNPSGTLVDRTMMTDIVQLLSKLMADAGITPNSLPDNVTNGYQLQEALEYAIANAAPANAAGEWIDAGNTPTFSVAGGGGSSITVDPADVLYNRFKIMGRTLFYSLVVQNATIAGPPTVIRVELPSDILALGLVGFEYVGLSFVGFYNGSATLTATTGGTSGPDQITLTNSGGFTVGANNQSFSFHIIAELTD